MNTITISAISNEAASKTKGILLKNELEKLIDKKEILPLISLASQGLLHLFSIIVLQRLL